MEDRQDKQDAQRILLIKETILSAEKSLETAKSLIAQLESKYAPQKKTYGVAEGGKIVEGTFDGQLMIGMDGRQYPVPEQIKTCGRGYVKISDYGRRQFYL